MFATTRGTVRRNKLSRLRRRAPLRHHRHEARRGRGHRRRADLHREGRRAADHRAAASASASPVTDVRVFAGPHLDGRARHQSRRGRQGDLACRSCATSTPPPTSARPISSAPTRCGAAQTATSRGGRRPTPRRRGDRRRDRARRAALCRDVGGRAVRADDLGEGLRQALVVLRIPDHQPRRQRHRRDGDLEGKKGAKTIRTRSAGWSPRSRSRRADQIMLVTDGGQLIRCPVDGIRIAGRSTQGVIVFNTADDETRGVGRAHRRRGRGQRRQLELDCFTRSSSVSFPRKREPSVCRKSGSPPPRDERSSMIRPNQQRAQFAA